MGDVRIRAVAPEALPAVSKLAAELIRLHHHWGAQRVGLNTAPQNADGQALFRSMGFRVTLMEMMHEQSGT